MVHEVIQRDTEGKAIWTDGDRLYVMVAVWTDKGYSANVNIQCPICRELSLSYVQATKFDMTAWCANCKRGIKQGKGAES